MHYTGSSLTMTGGGGGWTQSGMVFGKAGSNIETWNTGCTAQRLSRSCRVMECEPGCAMISYGPRNFLESFLEGRVRTPDNPYRGLILKSRFSWALAWMKFSIFSQFWPRLDQAIQIGPIFAQMAHQASKGWICARTMASGLKIY